MKRRFARISDKALNRIVKESVDRVVNEAEDGVNGERTIGTSTYRMMRVVSVERNNDKPSYYGKYKVGICFDDAPNGYIRYQYTDIKPKVGDRFKQEFDTESKKLNVNRIVKESIDRVVNEAENGGWKVDSSEAQEAYNLAVDYMGESTINKAIIRCLSSDALADCLAYIFRMYDFHEWGNR